MANGNGNGGRMAAIAPSKSTVVGGGLGLAISTVICWILGEFNIHVPGEVGAAIGAIASASLGYFFSGGKRSDTE